MNLKNLPHKIAIALFLIGAFVTYISVSIMSEDIQVFDSSSSSDAGIPE